MGETKIEWCDWTINPVVGCSHGCPYCYARSYARRIACMQAAVELREKYDIDNMTPSNRMALYKTADAWCQDCYDFKPHAHLERLDAITPTQKPKRIFIDSMWDWNCSDNDPAWMDTIIEKMRECSQHTFIVLSKRPGRFAGWDFPKNVWVGTTITSEADQEKVYELLDAKIYNLRFASYEPMLGLVTVDLSGLEWLILGAETGNRKGKVIPKRAWIENALVSCGNIPVFMKQSLKEHWTCFFYEEFPEARQ